MTVGSTKFEALIETVLSKRILQLLRQFGYRKCIIQAGSGEHQCLENKEKAAVNKFVSENVEINIYRFEMRKLTIKIVSIKNI